MDEGSAFASVVIPCLNDAPGLERVLTALQRQTTRPRLEIIVVDNGSSDGSLSVARRLADVVLEARDGNGSSAARNLGLARASHSLLLTTDADCVPANPDWAELHISAMRSAPADVLASTGPLLPFPCNERWAMRTDITPNAAFGTDGSPCWAINGSACYRTELLREIGGYPNYGANDAAVGHLATAKGLRIIWIPEAAAYHENGRGFRSYLAQRRKYGIYAAEIAGPPRSWIAYSGEVVRHLSSAAKPLARLDYTEAFARFGGAAATHSGALSVLLRPGRQPGLTELPKPLLSPSSARAPGCDTSASEHTGKHHWDSPGG
jgi:glycosyltransferase involved in cell wall biosynthesis